MVDITNIHSLSDFQRNTKQYMVQMQNTDKPIVLTVNGKARLVVQDADSYQRLLDRLEYVETVAALKGGIDDIEAGNSLSLDKALQTLRDKHDMQG